ncbi:hypothetical protein [Flavobacterium aquatile]|uniref:Uncharacterized protein n=1 Tax=Flavobacterium aquatile LMG 4008 = ATCC 11947 TaxID=1453498 RepID=A0A095SXT4_9FLAO|nr:hypothetical protein [Flavobacterium aquatile]KGD69387.1 hypothetical protein LG45_01035 [Flavobacterium aquatile LMG 4008 = ATCC 11947]OXA66156.1 hypothetical protein B0A61_12860 [Flavobacterium aquatile LMG 4008 = ATCC 11947]GEC77646.1 hypothetical protein FAQ01_05160 [Flavobacterium aquatile]
MKVNIQIKSIYSIEEIPNYWTNEDYVALLDAFSFEDGKSLNPENLFEMLQMAISDFEPKEAAKIVLTYKLSNDLNEGQIDQISNDMLIDKVCEEYPEIHMHKHLFSINQLLYKAYNGTFPNAKASLIKFSISDNELESLSKSDILKAFNNSLNDSNLIRRLFDEPMTTEAEFPDAESIIWELNTSDNSNFELITSEYWIDRESFLEMEFEGEILKSE